MTIRKLQALKAKKGFTLVELIVVIAIIAILAAILIPMLVNHVRSSRCSNILADLKSAVAVASEAYTREITRGGDADAAKAAGEGAVNGQEGYDGITVEIDDGGELADGEASVVADGPQGHSYSSLTGNSPCDWGRCPGNRDK